MILKLPRHRQIPLRNTLHPYLNTARPIGAEELPTNDTATTDHKQAQDIHPDLLRVHGSNFLEPATEGHVRLVFQNVRGISRGPDPAFELFEALRECNTGIFGVAEPNCGMDDAIVLPINAKLKKGYGTGFASVASTPGSVTSKTGYQPGGIMQLIQGEAARRHHSMGSDPLGKFTWMTLRGRNDRKLCVITAYRVCQKKAAPQ